jgi:hypothetical protein
MGLKTLISSTAVWVHKKLKPDDFYAVEQPDYGWDKLIKSFSDPAYKIAPTAYQTILSTDVIMSPLTKFAERMSGMSLTVVGSGKRRDKLQEIVDAAIGVGDALYWLSFAKVEGVRFLQHRAVLDADREMYIPDFRGCGARKWKAGGTIYWKGWQSDVDSPKESIGKLEEQNTGTDALDKASATGKWYNRKDFTVFRPGIGTNPEGDIDIILEYFLLAESARLLDKAMRVYADRYQLPREMLKEMIDKLRPDEMSARMRSGAAKIKQSDARQRMTMSAETAITLMEPSGTTWQFLTEYRTILEKRAYRLIFGEDLSMGGGSDGDRGGKEQGAKESFSGIVSFGKKIADALTTDWFEWLQELNDSFLPKLKKDEPKPYLDLRPSAEKQRLTVAELVQVADRFIPVNTNDVYATLGLDRPEGVPDVMTWAQLQKSQEPTDGKPGSKDQPSSTGDSSQRKDRPVPDSGMPAAAPQKDSNDLRNVKKDSA